MLNLTYIKNNTVHDFHKSKNNYKVDRKSKKKKNYTRRRTWKNCMEITTFEGL